MRLILSIYLLAITNFCFGQGFELIKSETETFYRILKDSINPKLNYPDGRYKLFLSDTNLLPSNVFYIKAGKVDGPYLELEKIRSTYGNYYKDSLWTFLTNPKDSTFKIGTWRTTYAFYSSYSGKYDNYSTTENNFKMPYDANGKFTEIWLFHMGLIAREATYQKGFGLKKETYWDFETNEISEQTINKGSKNYYQSIVYKNDSISYVSLIQNGIEVIIDFNYMVYFCENGPCTEVSVYTDNCERNDMPIATMSIDSSKTLTDIKDMKRRIFLSETEDGNIQVRYWNKKGKLKFKKLKTK